MFAGVNEKLERAGHFLNNLKTLAGDEGGFAYIKREKQQEMRANLDGFFFEIISAKDFFLQGINDHYRLGLKKNKATDTDRLIRELGNHDLNNALKVVTTIKEFLNEKKLRPEQKLRDDQYSWLWRLKNYRNSATHRELIHPGHEAEATIQVNKDLFDKIQQGKLVIKPICEGEEGEIPPEVPRVYVPRENIKTYLFKDPEDSSKGNTDIEVIPYCKQSLTRMKELLERLYSELGLK
jgi:hypothetical protein